MAIISNVTSQFEVSSFFSTPAPTTRFSVPSLSWGVAADLEEPIAFASSKVGPPYVITGVLSDPESNILEPTIGQIWPR
jgi:hypothetical protein